MKRGSATYFGVLLLLASLAGCNICQSPFDYCGAVTGPGGFPNCDFGARAGSAFAPMSDDTSGETGTLTPKPAAPQAPIDDSMTTSPNPEAAEIDSGETITR